LKTRNYFTLNEAKDRRTEYKRVDYDRLKSITSDDTIDLVNKGKYARVIRDILNLLRTRNNDLALQYDDKDRRICAFKTSPAYASPARYKELETRNHNYFASLIESIDDDLCYTTL
jgi:hypothetical protein